MMKLTVGRGWAVLTIESGRLVYMADSGVDYVPRQQLMVAPRMFVLPHYMADSDSLNNPEGLNS